ncbi:ABC transporter [Pokkaliibacter plantistimulans]|uniref:ABC transporter n=1 Tax=Proteobacteria bacterium 228 TaxID=2083153 RepID=A0A2S5KGS5_9PROT|nr:ABC transporter ATP-binding protein [Pokkaliibacter plantistimulans]PPC74007.1 ABC transporter [Pokkaliibacter plantistimulans]
MMSHAVSCERACLSTDLPLATPLANAVLVDVKDVNVHLYNRQILQNINLTIHSGEFMCVVGPSGCGKTTLLRALAGLTAPSTGQISYQNQPLTSPRSDIAVVFQDYSKALLPWRTAKGNIALALEAIGTPQDQHDTIIDDLLSRMGLAKHANKYPSQMSGGMQQRLQIARCLAQRPALLLMDEPFGALDAMTRQTLQDELLALVAETGTTVFFVTHDLEEAVYLSSRVLGLAPNPGRVAALFDVDLPYPRDQLNTRELPEFLHLRRTLFNFIESFES